MFSFRFKVCGNESELNLWSHTWLQYLWLYAMNQDKHANGDYLLKDVFQWFGTASKSTSLRHNLPFYGEFEQTMRWLYFEKNDESTKHILSGSGSLSSLVIIDFF